MRAAAACGLIAIVLTSPPARAAPSPAAVAQARHRVERARALHIDGRFEEALQLYLAAYQLIPSPDLLFNIGLVQEKRLAYAECVRTFRRFLAESDDQSLRARAQDRIARCQEQVRLRVRVSSVPPGAAVTVSSPGQEPTFAGRTPTEIELRPGRPTVKAELAGHAPHERVLELDIESDVNVDFVLDPLAELTVECDARGALVQLDNDVSLASRVAQPVLPGAHVIRASGVGYRTHIEKVLLAPGERRRIPIRLIEVPIDRRVSLESNVMATVDVDGRVLGTTPLHRTLPSGSHQVTVAAPGWKTASLRVDLPRARDLSLAARLHPAERQPKQRLTLWTLAAASVLSLTTAGMFGWLAFDDHRAYSEQPTLSLSKRGGSRAHMADAFLGASAALGVAAFWYHRKTAPPPSVIEIK
jgi:hypothetical protein